MAAVTLEFETSPFPTLVNTLILGDQPSINEIVATAELGSLLPSASWDVARVINTSPNHFKLSLDESTIVHSNVQKVNYESMFLFYLFRVSFIKLIIVSGYFRVDATLQSTKRDYKQVWGLADEYQGMISDMERKQLDFMQEMKKEMKWLKGERKAMEKKEKEMKEYKKKMDQMQIKIDQLKSENEKAAQKSEADRKKVDQMQITLDQHEVTFCDILAMLVFEAENDLEDKRLIMKHEVLKGLIVTYQFSSCLQTDAKTPGGRRNAITETRSKYGYGNGSGSAEVNCGFSVCATPPGYPQGMVCISQQMILTQGSIPEYMERLHHYTRQWERNPKENPERVPELRVGRKCTELI
ncbi:hypothetical protein BDQ17DRAFT_1419635 [Cyathus striatus]|nr:hypothetical protein BDQ17DRAFT_1419635 [Cyathus striatus]